MITRKLSACFCLLIYLMMGVGNGQAPLLFMVLGHTHKTYVDYNDEGTRLTLHHPGYPDQHEPTPRFSSSHRLDVLDLVLAAITGQDDREDHIFQIPANKPQAIAAIKTFEIPKALSLPVSNHPFPSFAELASLHTLARPPPRIDPTLASRRTTVLLI